MVLPLVSMWRLVFGTVLVGCLFLVVFGPIVFALVVLSLRDTHRQSSRRQPWRGRRSYPRPRRTMSAEYPDDWDELRRKVYRRAGYRCQNCDRTNIELHAHHIVPLSVGGTNALTNLACLCRDCHEAIHPHMRDDGLAWGAGEYDSQRLPSQEYTPIPDAKLRW